MPEGTITALRVQEHDPQRINVFIDEAFALGVGQPTLLQEHLYVGKYIDAAQWARLEAAENTAKALQTALRFLQARSRSTDEIRQRLIRGGFAASTIEHTIDRLRELDLLDDAAFARAWVEQRNICNPRGRQVLRHELQAKGIDAAIVAATLDDETLLGDEYQRALELARARLPRYASAPDYTAFQRRLGGFLQRRGFPYATIKSIVARMWDELQGTAQ